MIPMGSWQSPWFPTEESTEKEVARNEMEKIIPLPVGLRPAGADGLRQVRPGTGIFPSGHRSNHLRGGSQLEHCLLDRDDPGGCRTNRATASRGGGDAFAKRPAGTLHRCRRPPTLRLTLSDGSQWTITLYGLDGIDLIVTTPDGETCYDVEQSKLAPVLEIIQSYDPPELPITPE